ncbi:hypothetical protein SAMN04515674_12157 [Pseudarcicella hirudinis]|uniref:Uncharacterized protein n=1 Tax=Pseudarcicella hirudinis TaxID=1079859 RepID=A0A1I5X5K7_9BACT|nr:hypothetical protein [Pseudarcicella hirudinis]SFQ27106.1 hypothetical protein SAMN04515674_113143 [Pseudarcicella hirudinis]SFQ47514.1 hypothetical protein SAMN04515674_12157 [Pseudarcicella hirudinis]
MSERKEVLNIIFNQYPKESGFFVTSDNQAFTKSNENDAKNHAKTLEDKEVLWVERTPSTKASKPVKKGGKSGLVDVPDQEQESENDTEGNS